ncbi:two-component sensor histidine kinase [Dactylosporangium vinaceum]|uniref:histidine kinase n=1 Tax=Dactylosporangium vinaceum TaxID=53362 RepID=A0ABV5M918_9ACTN|nr:histidine kinase [Dactylosporangium vinaceum]UAB99492.1 two-component sensor histidine kinase [Dactylosporangium vinaceum]
MRMRADVAVAAAVAAICAIVLSGRTGATQHGGGLLDWAACVLLPAPLIWRRRAPVLVLWGTALLLVLLGPARIESPAGLFVPLAALHAVARYRPARFVWPGVAAVVLPGWLNRLDEAFPWTAFAAVTAITVAAALIGINQRTRHAYLTALEDRARRLELDRDREARLAVAEERTRIARDMHDIVAHNLAVMVALADGAAATVPADPGRAADVMRQASATGRQALDDMRRLVGLLRRGTVGPPRRSPVAPQPGLDDLDALVDGVRAAGVRVALIRDGTPGPWGPGAGLVVYRIVQEALTNTLKHAGPSAAAEVRLRFDQRSAELTIVDDGAGRAAGIPDAADRHGLTGMRERAAFYGGAVEAGPRDGAGWQVRARLSFESPVLA